MGLNKQPRDHRKDASNVSFLGHGYGFVAGVETVPFVLEALGRGLYRPRTRNRRAVMER